MNAISNPTEVNSKDINRAINVTGSRLVGGVFVAANTGYGIYAEYEKDKLREEYKQWKAKGAK